MVVDQLDPVSRERSIASAASVFALSITLLMLPKVYSVIALVRDPIRLAHLGGWRKVLASTLIESVVSMLIAPIMMLFHTRFVVTTLRGESVQWNAQNRGEGGFNLLESVRNYRGHTLAGIVATIVVGVFCAAPVAVVPAGRVWPRALRSADWCSGQRGDWPMAGDATSSCSFLKRRAARGWFTCRKRRRSDANMRRTTSTARSCSCGCWSIHRSMPCTRRSSRRPTHTCRSLPQNCGRRKRCSTTKDLKVSSRKLAG